MVIDREPIDLDEIQRIGALFFGWMILLIFGGGITEFLSHHTGYQVITMLVANKHDVVVIDKDRETCETIYTETGAVIIHGSATDIRILEKAGVRNSDAVACILRDDGDNIAAAILAKSLGVPSIIAVLRKPDYEEAYHTVGVTKIISTTDLLANQIMMEIEQPKVKKIMSIGGGKAEIYAVQVPIEAKSVGMTIREIAQHKNFPQDCVFVGIYNVEEDNFSFPRGDHMLNKWDNVFLISPSASVKQATDFLTKK